MGEAITVGGREGVRGVEGGEGGRELGRGGQGWEKGGREGVVIRWLHLRYF